jgi:hypothetical protein
MQTMNHPLNPLVILTNHTRPTRFPYYRLVLRVNVGSQPYISPNPLDNAHLRPFPPPLYQPLQLLMIIPHNLPPFPQHA